MSAELILLCIFACLFTAILAGFPVAFSVAGLGLIFGVISNGTNFFDLAASAAIGVMSSETLVAIPLFVFMGNMLDKSGIAESLFKSIYMWLRPIPGGLSIGTIIICTILAATTGIIGTTEVLMGVLALPEMIKRNYDNRLACGTILAGGALGILIPPSIMLVMYGPGVGISVGKLFMAAIPCGLLLSAIFIIYVFIRCFINPELAPKGLEDEDHISFKEKIKYTFFALTPPAFLVLTVLGTIFFGLATPTEAAACGAVGSIIVTACYKKLNLNVLKETADSTILISAMILIVTIGASVFTTMFMAGGYGQIINEMVLKANLSANQIIALLLLIVFIMGFVLDWISILLIFIPIFAQITAQMGIDKLYFGVLVCLMLQTSFLTPPMAPAIFYLRGVAPPSVKTSDMMIGLIPFCLLQLLCVVVIAMFPEIVLWLPNKMIK
ncbi:MAG TPA: C4-dicarboxylate ABC transporter permease [Coxiellaceae bacterium]|nr:C4-dicarboxylate ABC transporter permease [Coxiellaceae bacterium]HBY55581.1 C4-dicarboxylate ABC transporter permease [Coxiellaceae bacterium]